MELKKFIFCAYLLFLIFPMSIKGQESTSNNYIIVKDINTSKAEKIKKENLSYFMMRFPLNLCSVNHESHGRMQY